MAANFPGSPIVKPAGITTGDTIEADHVGPLWDEVIAIANLVLLNEAALSAAGSDITVLQSDVSTNAADIATNAADILSLQSSVAGKQDASEKGQPNGYASLDGSGRVPASQLSLSAMEYLGQWDASSNTPTLSDGTGSTGDMYRVSVAGTQDLGSGSLTFNVGDYAIHNGSTWEVADNSDGAYLPLAGGTMSGDIDMGTNDISNATFVSAVDRMRATRFYAYPDATYGTVSAGLDLIGNNGRLILGNNVSFPDWSITHAAPNVATLGTSDWLRCQVDPVDPEDLVRLSFLSTQLSGKADSVHNHTLADVTDAGTMAGESAADYVEVAGDTMSGPLIIGGTGDMLQVKDSVSDTNPRFNIRGADGAVQWGTGGGSAEDTQLQRATAGSLTLTGIGAGAGTSSFLAFDVNAKEIHLDSSPTHGNAFNTVELNGDNGVNPFLAFGDGASATDWQVQRSSVGEATITGATVTGDIGFHGVTPVGQSAHVADPAGGATIDVEARSAINDILLVLEAHGLTATS